MRAMIPGIASAEQRIRASLQKTKVQQYRIDSGFRESPNLIGGIFGARNWPEAKRMIERHNQRFPAGSNYVD